MNTQAAAMKEQTPRSSTEKSVSTINSTDALAMVEHGGELTIGITTPVGTTFRCKTAFIGRHSDNIILAELPKLSDDDLDFFFQEGFWATVRAISPRGEGAIVHFRAQLQHIMLEPVPIFTLSVPQAMQVTQLRKEPRYEVNLTARVIAETHKLDSEIRDLSRSGCRFVTAPLSRPFQVGDEIEIQVPLSSRNNRRIETLYGKVCNLQRSLHYARYGVAFTENGKDHAKALLSQLKFDGTKLTLK